MDAIGPIVREALVVVATLSLPTLGVATFVGLLVAIVQAATSIQEQTLSTLPKMLAVGVMLAMLGGFGMRMCAGLFTDAIALVPMLVRGGA